VALPDIVSKLVPVISDHAHTFGIELGFKDWDDVKEEFSDHFDIKNLWHYFVFSGKQVVMVVIGIVVAISLFVNREIDLARGKHPMKNNLYSLTTDQISLRFQTFFASFRTVMGAQVVISSINTALTAVFIFGSAYIFDKGLAYPKVLTIMTFFCGLFPILGNLVSNTLITSVALTVSPKLAIAALAFLIILHKLEYFLNSKIIGDRISNPMWLTLLALLLGERLMGIPGMILAPVVFHYVKMEAAQIAALVPSSINGKDAGNAPALPSSAPKIEASSERLLP
jgi:predicted PurR-regulated permease PerM